MIKKRATAVMVCLGMMTGLMAGSIQTVQAQEDEREEITIAWVVDNVDISQRNLYDTAVDYANYLNDTRDDIHIELTLFDGTASVEKQISDIETAIAMGVDCISLASVEPEGIRPAAEAAMEAGIKVLNWRDEGDWCTVHFIAANEDKKGQAQRDWTRQYLEENPDAVLYAGLQYGATSHPNCFPRMQYMKDLEEEFPDRFQILVEQYSDWSTNTSMTMVEDWLQAYPQMNYIASASEEQMLGVIEAVKIHSSLDDFVLVTHNGEQTGIDMLKNGEVEMVVAQTFPIFAQGIIDYCVKMQMEDFTGSVDMSDYSIKVLTPENVADYEKLIQVDYYNNQYYEPILADSYK
ncbi:MAG: sugar ABC transporter substrate-binding protein [Lachnospiraceae bacterium]|nr:sugar ABC transporter substrate-binding protein [Lachnospiraceae bacterium]